MMDKAAKRRAFARKCWDDAYQLFRRIERECLLQGRWTTANERRQVESALAFAESVKALAKEDPVPAWFEAPQQPLDPNSWGHYSGPLGPQPSAEEVQERERRQQERLNQLQEQRRRERERE